MINENELRIGNYYDHNEQWNAGGYNGTFKFGMDDFGSILECTMWLENISGIALTPEILSKCGYVLVNPNVGSWSNDSQDLPYLYELKGGGFIMSNGVGMRFLHELQNRIYSLTGKELEVNL